MDQDQATALYTPLTDEEKVDCLARIASHLTICFRDVAYTQAQTPENHLKLQGINELQHQLISQLERHFHHNNARYSDDVFLAGLFEQAQHYATLSFLQQSLARGLSPFVQS